MGEPSEARVAEIVRTAAIVAVVGMKDESERAAAAFYVPASMKALGIRVLPVNPKLREALGERAVARLSDLGEVLADNERLDIVQVFRRSDAVPAVADEVLALPSPQRPKVVWLQLGIVHEAAARKLKAAGIEVVMNRCFKVDAALYRR